MQGGGGGGASSAPATFMHMQEVVDQGVGVQQQGMFETEVCVEVEVGVVVVFDICITNIMMKIVVFLLLFDQC